MGTQARWDEWTPLGGGIEEAPADGKIYGRCNGAWVEISAVDPDPDTPSLSLSPSSVSIPADGTAQTVTVTSDTSWTVG
jgi:hypothetical protein